MIPLLVVSGREEVRTWVTRALDGERPVFTAATAADALTLLRTTPVDLILQDLAAPRDPEALARALRNVRPGAILIAAGETPPEDVELWRFYLPVPSNPGDLGRVLRDAEDRAELVGELEAFRRATRTGPGASPTPNPDARLGALGQILGELAKALSTSFDLGKMLENFLDTVVALARPSRVALLTRERPGGYRIRAHRGLEPWVVESVAFHAEAGLPLWFARHGRILTLTETEQPTSPYPELRRELELLHAEVALPLSAQGQPSGILALGPRITGAPYLPSELELLYQLGVHLATAVQDIVLHQDLERQKAYIERILAEMGDGVITIDERERVVIFNRRAEEILGRSSREILGEDLRVLPSPLGDLLYAALTRGRALRKDEVTPPALKRPLEVTTYRILEGREHPAGAVMVLEDLTPRKELAKERRTAEDRELLTKFVARLADEIKNPLVSIQTFVELLTERDRDPEFNERFQSVVRTDIRRLVHMVEKLTNLVADREYALEVVDVRLVLEETLRALDRRVEVRWETGEETSQLLYPHDELSGRSASIALHSSSGPLPIRCDRKELRKALTYLIRYLLRKGDEDGKLVCSLATRTEEREPVLDCLLGGRAGKVSEDEIRHLFDPFAMSEEGPLDVGPCVSHRIIEQLGGILQARREREGVVFHVRFPLVREQRI